MISRSVLALIGALGLGLAAIPAAHAETSALGNAAALSAKTAAEGAGPNELFPPLPSLASLPPSAAEQVEEAAPVVSGRRPGKKGRRVVWHRAAAEPSVRMIVSDESQAYLNEVDRKLDDALRNTGHEAGTVSVALTR
ncbi:hypothetical protein [Trinickia dinghuensis]|uniref:Uncharacterized protein n=1 Tax=Trinickia dinghuensis TaxID=2291023 RepID=A0A3D8JZ03_9BURK|nr:hypothetical protein [Trinickia dinghuensis]RDU98278.1 hypothetical protein DWV00_13235 [Trinickia dinghuensis]